MIKDTHIPGDKGGGRLMLPISIPPLKGPMFDQGGEGNREPQVRSGGWFAGLAGATTEDVLTARGLRIQ